MKINFNKLTNDYQNNLLDTLRGFGDKDFLKYWVPDSNSYKSLLNLLDALFEFKIYKFDIEFENNSNLVDKILELNGKVGSLKKLNNVIEFEISNKDYETFRTKKIKVTKIKKKINEEIVNFLEDKKKSLKLEREYKDLLNNFIFSEKNFYKLKKINNLDKNFFYCDYNLENNKFFYCLIDKKNSIIKETGHNFDEGVLKNFFNLTCSKILNHDICEAAEHASIYINYEITKKLKKPKNFGIFFGHNGGEIFNFINFILRKFYNDFLSEEKKSSKFSKSYISPSTEWKNLSDKDKIILINKFMNKELLAKYNLKENDLILFRIVNHHRLEFELGKKLSENILNDTIIKIEEDLKSKFDESIELHAIEKKDINKLRLTNAPKSI